jgi:hypothetical protein
MKVRSMVGGLLLLAVTAGTALAQRARQGTDVAPPLEKILAYAKSADSAQLAELVEIKPALPLGPADVLKEYAQAMALIAQGMSADVVNISRAQDANQITREQAEFLIEERYQVAMMQYQVLSALHDTLEHDIGLEATRAKQVGAVRGPDTDVVVVLPSSAPSAQAK